MHIDTVTLPRGPRRSTCERLREELQALARGHALFVAHSEKSWASITFAGARHRIDLAFEGAEAVEAAENFIAWLPEHEFALPRQLVADAAVTGVDHRIGPDPRMDVRIELLVLDED
jgi:hypothetical protein